MSKLIKLTIDDKEIEVEERNYNFRSSKKSKYRHTYSLFLKGNK